MAKADYVAPKVIGSLNEVAEEGVAVQLDLAEDAWSYGAPPPWGIYDFKLFVDKDGVLQGLEDPKDPRSVYFQFNLIGKIVGGDYDGVPCYTRVNTRIYRGKNISTMAGLLSKLVKDPKMIPNPISPKKLAGLFEQVIKREPIVKGELDWKGSYSYPNPKDPKETLYENVYRSAKEFPEDPENKGQKLHLVMVTNSHTGGKVEVRAMTQIVRFFGKGEAPAQVGLVSAPKLVSASNVVNVPELIMPGGGGVTLVNPTGGQKEEEDIALMLAD